MNAVWPETASVEQGELTIGGIAWASPPRRVSLPDDLPIPYSPPLEDESLPSVEAIAAAARSTLGR